MMSLLQALVLLVELSSLISVVSALAPTTDRAQLVKDLQTCVTSQDVIHRVGRHVNSRVDPTGDLARLVLVRLSKQWTSVDNDHSNDPSQWAPSVWDDSTEKVLSAVVTSLVEADLESEDVCETLVEGTKCASVISRLIRCNSVKEPLDDFWRRMGGRLVPSLDAQRLSGLHWAMEGFRLSDPGRFIPSEIEAAYTDLDLPFRIIPGCLKDLSALSLEQLNLQVEFGVDDIRTNSKQLIKERRQTAWEGDEGVAPFAYAGKAMTRKPWSPVVRAVRDHLVDETLQYYDGCLLNLYPDGGSGMRYHIDPDQGTLWDYDTAVVSAGATRRIAFREIDSHISQPYNFVLMHGDVTCMFGDCQERFQHTVKKADNKRENAARASLVYKRTWNYKG